jgi:hypothetical protein
VAVVTVGASLELVLAVAMTARRVAARAELSPSSAPPNRKTARWIATRTTENVRLVALDRVGAVSACCERSTQTG